MKEKLKLCPFCGAKAKIDGCYTDYEVLWVNIECSECECTTPDFEVPDKYSNKSYKETESAAIVVWNKRV